jgi:signal transduction histidine kinase
VARTEPVTTATRRARWPTVAARWTLALLVRLDVRATVVTLVILGGVALLAVEAPVGAVSYGLPVLVAFLLAMAHAGCVPLASIRPATAGFLSIGAATALQALTVDHAAQPWPWWVVMLITEVAVLFVIGLLGSWRVAIACWIGSIATSMVVAGLHGGSATDSINLVLYSSVSAGFLVVSVVLAQWHRIRALLLREREVSAVEYSRRMLAEERARIARELHDVVAHSMSIINVQAATARYRHPDFDARALAEFEDIGAASRQALDEMRGLLDVLRDGDGPGEKRPQPRFEDLPELVAHAERAGLRVTFASSSEARGAPIGEVVGLVAYRIVQEALSNAIRHAPGSAVEVRCDRRSDVLELLVLNRPAGTSESGSPGYGLIGMAERAGSVGGTVRSEATDDGGFIVAASLPLRQTAKRGRP